MRFFRRLIAGLLIFGFCFLLDNLDLKSQSFLVMAQASQLVLFSASDQIESSQWRIVNDGVMGGVSSSSIRRTSDGSLLFKGEVSLENNGGFASFRHWIERPIPAGFRGVALKVRGDGKRYQFRFRLKSNFDGIAYRSTFTAEEEWQVVRLRFESFIPSFRGRRVAGAPELDSTAIRQMGILISDYQEGPFQIEIQSISLFK